MLGRGGPLARLRLKAALAVTLRYLYPRIQPPALVEFRCDRHDALQHRLSASKIVFMFGPGGLFQKKAISVIRLLIGASIAAPSRSDG